LGTGEWLTLLLGAAAIFIGAAAIYQGRTRHVLVALTAASLLAAAGVGVTSWLVGDTGHPRDQESKASAPSTGSSTSSANSSSPPPPAEDAADRYVLEFQMRTYVDLDSRAVSLEAGPQYELFLEDEFHFLKQNGTTIVIVPDAEANSFEGCARGTRIQPGEDFFLLRPEDDESICVKTTEGAWAVMKHDDERSGALYETFHVRIFVAP
jgi:hypothetical protein